MATSGMMSGAGLDIITVTTLDGMAGHREAWLACRAASGMRTVNNHPLLFDATVRAMDGGVRPMMMRIDVDGRPAGMLVGRVSRRSHEQRLGYASVKGPCLDVLDVVYGGLMIDPLERATVCRVIRTELEAMRARGGLDLVLFNHLPTELAVELDPQSPTERDKTGDPDDVAHWRLSARDGLRRFVSERQSKKHRGNLRRSARKLEEELGRPLELSRTCRVDGLDRFLNEARTITRSSYQASFNPFAEDEPAMAAVMREAGARLDALSCYELAAGDVVLAYQAGLIIDEAYHLLATAYRPTFAAHSPGQLLLMRVIDDLDRRGVKTVDYGFGDAPYKRSYGSHCSFERCVRLHGQSLRGRLDSACTMMRDRMMLAAGRIRGGDAATTARSRWRSVLRSKAA
jgi:CelD/BcsL family acetyltransferase involved in cellulose biosynthesis